MQTTLCTPANDFQKFFATNHAPEASAYPTIAPTVAKRGGIDGIIPLNSGQQNPFNFGKIALWAVGTANSTFNVKFVGWSMVQGNQDLLPMTLADLSCTIGSTTRAYTSENMVGALSVNGGLIIAASVIDPADGGIQYLKLDLTGVQYLQMVPGTKSGNVTSINGALCGY